MQNGTLRMIGLEVRLSIKNKGTDDFIKSEALHHLVLKMIIFFQ